MMRAGERACAAALMAALLAQAGPVGASLLLSPVRVVLQAKPKESATGFFKVENQAAEPIRVTVEPEDWADGVSGERQAPDWLKVKPSAFWLKPGKGARVDRKSVV